VVVGAIEAGGLDGCVDLVSLAALLIVVEFVDCCFGVENDAGLVGVELVAGVFTVLTASLYYYMWQR